MRLGENSVSIFLCNYLFAQVARNALIGVKIEILFLHPGIVKTGLDPSSHGAKEALDAEEAIAKLWNVMQSKSLEKSGTFWYRIGTSSNDD